MSLMALIARPADAGPAGQPADAGPADTRRASRGTALRIALLLGCAAAVALAAWVGRLEPSGMLADPALARLLRGIALIKAALVLGGAGAIHWRFGHPLTNRLAGTYLAGLWATAGASTLIWQLALIAWAAALFHLGALLLLAAAWRDGRLSMRRAVG